MTRRQFVKRAGLWVPAAGLISLLLPRHAMAALPVSDAFTGTTGTDLSTYNANWTTNVNGFELYNNALQPKNLGAWAYAHWNADSFGNDQYAEAVVTRIYEADGQMGVAVRMHASAATCYSATWTNNGYVYLTKWVNGTYTGLGNYNGISAGNTIRLEVSGTSLVVKQNGTSRISATDSSISAGSAGVVGWTNISEPDRPNKLDDFAAGNMAAAGGRRKVTIAR